MGERIAIIGVGETEFRSRNVEASHVDLVNLAVKRALENAQLTIKDIDTVITGQMELFEGLYLPDMWLVEGTGAYLKAGMRIQTGGTTGTSVATTAFCHAASGEFKTVREPGPNDEVVNGELLLRTVFDHGMLWDIDTFDEVRDRAELAVPTPA